MIAFLFRTIKASFLSVIFPETDQPLRLQKAQWPWKPVYIELQIYLFRTSEALIEKSKVVIIAAFEIQNIPAFGIVVNHRMKHSMHGTGFSACPRISGKKVDQPVARG